MNREIKFRGKSLNEQWYYGYLTTDAYGKLFIESASGIEMPAQQLIRWIVTSKS